MFYVGFFDFKEKLVGVLALNRARLPPIEFISMQSSANFLTNYQGRSLTVWEVGEKGEAMVGGTLAGYVHHTLARAKVNKVELLIAV